MYMIRHRSLFCSHKKGYRPKSALETLSGTDSQSLIVNIRDSFLLIVNINNTTMKQEKFNGAHVYTSPSLFLTEISVEHGFAQSGPEGMDPMSLDAPDYTDGVTL